MKISKVSKAFIWPVLATHAHAVLSDFHKALTRYSIDILEGNTQPLERTIAQISDPTSSQYGQYLSREEAFALIQPVESTVGKMKRWLRDLRIRRYEVVPFDTDAVESSFQNQVKSGTVELDCTSQMTPECLRKLYRMGDYAADPQQNTLLGIIGFNQSAQYKELDLFLRKYVPEAVGTSFSIESVNGGKAVQSNTSLSGEANTDMQYAVALAKNIDFRFYAVGGGYQGFNTDLDAPDHSQAMEPFFEMALYFALLPNNQLPSVISISYGANEQLWPKSEAIKICNLFGLLAVRGVSVIAASGDQGAGISCQSNDESKRVRFLPSFPGTCPYVTAVGATQSINLEEALAYSSGGFSEYWSTPFWQKAQVKKYIDNHGEEWKGYYNPAGRAVPDLAMQGDWNHPFFYHGEETMTGGTSVSAPQFAAMIALINNARAQKGKPPLGFLNPLLYLGAGGAFTDIIKGNSTGCPGTSFAGLPSPFVPNAGWAAVEGWDPVTGLGTPLFDQLLRLAGN